MTRRIYSHAVANYVERVLNLENDMAGQDVQEFAREQIEQAYKDPEMVYEHDDDRPPIHIRNGCAVPVEHTGTGVVISTAYSSGTFLSKMNGLESNDNGRENNVLT